MSDIDLSFVIIEYHSLDQVLSAVTSISDSCRNMPHEIVISSNSCYEQTKQESLEREFPNLRWKFNERNLGFAGGMNAGIECTEGRAVVIINPDVMISGGDIRQAFDYLMSQPEVALVGPRIVDEKGKLQDSCREFMTPASLATRILKRLLQKKDVLLRPEYDYTQVQLVDWVIGAFMMVKREALEKVGLLDADYLELYRSLLHNE